MAAALDTRKGGSRRGAIMAAASRLLSNKGFTATTTLAIARAAGISKRDLYSEFPSKARLLEAMIDHGVREMARSLTMAAPTTRAAFFEMLEAFGGAFLTAMLGADRIGLYRAAIAESATVPALGRALLDTGGGYTLAIVRDFFRAASVGGLVDFPAVDAATAIYFRMLLGDLMLTALLDPTRRPDQAGIEVRARCAVEVMARLEGVTWQGVPRQLVAP